MFRRGDLVESDGLLAVVVVTEGEAVETDEGAEKVPDGHVAVWFGDPQARRISEGGLGDAVPVLWTIPEDYCRPAARKPAYRQ